MLAKGKAPKVAAGRASGEPALHLPEGRHPQGCVTAREGEKKGVIQCKRSYWGAAVSR